LRTLHKAVVAHHKVIVYGLGEGTWSPEMLSMWLDEVIFARKLNHELWIADASATLRFQLEMLNLGCEMLHSDIAEVSHVKRA
jgi:hypothetical protein